MSTICEYCETSITKNNLIKHQKSDTCNKIKLLLNKQKNNYELQLKLEDDKNKKLSENNINLNQKILTLEIQLKESLNKYEDLRKIVEKAATKSTVKNYTHNNYLNYISTEPIKFNEFKTQLKQIVNCETIMYNDQDFHDHIVDNILRDKSGKDKVLCTDINRKNFTYKDENSGELISDPELERIREQLKKGTDIRQIRKDLLEKLVYDYEENGSVGVDPYKQFSDIIQKLNFGTPFVDHMAKKTYVKRCPSLKSKSSKDDILNTNIEIESDYDWSGDPDEDEYQKLLSEFG